MKSLDPRITRLNISEKEEAIHFQETPDQLVTFEVFLQKKENSPYEHVGIIHAPDKEMAFVFAKEQFSRRFTCTGLMIAETTDVRTSIYTDQEMNVYDTPFEGPSFEEPPGRKEQFEVFHLYKRGKQHRHVGSVEADTFDEAFLKAKTSFYEKDKPVLNVWIIKKADILMSDEKIVDIWSTLPEKSHRDVTSYRAKDKIDQFKEKQSTP